MICTVLKRDHQRKGVISCDACIKDPAIFGQKRILSQAGRYQLNILLPFNFTYHPKNLTTKIMVKGI